MKQLDEKLVGAGGVENAEKDLNNQDTEIKGVGAEDIERKGPIGEEALEDIKTVITEDLDQKLEGFKKAASGLDSGSRVDLQQKAKEELAQLLDIKKESLVVEYGSENQVKVESMIAALSSEAMSKLDDSMQNISAGESAFEAGQHGMAMAEGLQEEQRANAEARLEAEKNKNIDYLKNNGIDVEGMDSFALKEKASETRAEVRGLREDLKARGVHFIHGDVMTHPDGELAALKELDEQNKVPEEPKKKTVMGRIRGFFGSE